MKRVLAMLQSCVLFALMAATGEAGEKKIPKQFESENMEATIISKYRDGRPVTPTCSQRMRDAMKAVDPYINGRDGFRIYRHSTGETILERQSNWLPDLDKKKQWNDTMEACVK